MDKDGWKAETWTQFGVRIVRKGIPGIDKPGVLSPETAARKAAGLTAGLDLTDCAAEITQLEIPNGDDTIPISVYRRRAQSDAPAPAVICFHGGAFRTGSRRDIEPPMLLLCQKTDAVVFNVEYRLAPQYRYPCATDDCWQAVKYVYRHARELGIDAGNITVCGDSAGGTLAAACARRDRNYRTRMIRRQILIYPVLALFDPSGMKDYSFSVDHYQFDDAYAPQIIAQLRALAAISAGGSFYTKDETQARLPDASPLADRSFRDIPETLILCGEFDFVLEQSRTYAKYLAQAGTAVKLVIYRGMMHGFMNFTGIFPQAENLVEEMADFILNDRGG